MKTFIFASLLIVAVAANLVKEHGAEFQAFKLRYGKIYKNQAEETKRFNIFKDNARVIKKHNALYEQGLESYKQGINKFTDMTQEEFKTMLTLSSSYTPNINGTKHVKTGRSIPDSVDWRTKGQVTGVKDQGSCGSCWAFSLTGSTEAAYYRKSGNLISLSEQQLVDCTTDVNDGCSGGYLEKNFDYLEQKGLESEADYPYTAMDGTCLYSTSKVVTKISGYKVNDKGDEDGLLDSVANIGPVSIALDASYLSSYAGGIFESDYCSSLFLNHAVLSVGYGVENGKKFWIVKNSWGADWGENGYFRLLRGANECGCAQDTAYPIIN